MYFNLLNLYIKHVGALTSKPYAYSARPWELENIDSTDFHDTFGSNIQISVRGSEILRILPKTNENLNEEWITDKIRYSYDSVKHQRLTQPLMKEGNKFKSISWEKAYSIIKEKYDQKYQFNGVLGNVTDAETAFLFKEFINKIGNGYILSGNNLSTVDVDNRTNYLFNINFNQLNTLDNCLIVGCNLRLEAPLLNLKLRKNVLYNNLKVFVLGYYGDFNYPVTFIGNSTGHLFKILEGKHVICKLLNSSLKSHIFVGKFLMDQFLDLFTYIKKYSNVSISVIQQFIIDMISCEFNINHKFSVQKTKKQLLYILNNEEVTFNKKKIDFVIYQGHHGGNICSKVDLILPGSMLYEKNATIINMQGIHQSINFCSKPPVLARNDWKIFQTLIIFLGLNVNFKNISDIREYLNNIAPARDLTYTNNNNISINKLFNFSNKYLNTNLHNFYLTDIVSKNSHNLALASARFNLHNINFIK